MASSQHSSSTSPLQGCVDPIDIDSFIKYEQISYQSPSISPSISRSHSAVRASSSVNPNNTLLPPDSAQGFSGPSHQYGSYKQQTGLPSGALSTTHSVNQPNNAAIFRATSSFNSGFPIGGPEEIIDFNCMNDTEMDFNLQNIFMDNDTTMSAATDFIDPSVLGTQEDVNAAEASVISTQSSNVGRLYPGAHQQQAALAKQQQQQQQQQQARRPSSQRPSRFQANDPIAEQKITQLLKTMRQTSVASSGDDDDGNGTNQTSHRIKKDEEDMDEDERLLASEEGKKLSSKERRQLRNKVSARAFRSRRKEYIGQLEGELNAKNNEASDLRMQNKALLEENTRLSDLTRMLLSSPAFSTFLDEMSTEGLTAAPQAAPPQQAESTQRNLNKDANPFAVVQQLGQNQDHNGPQVGMTLIPDNAMDFLTPANGNNIYNNWATNQPQVFSVMEIPTGPAMEAIDTTVLSGKSNSDSFLSTIESKIEAPVIERHVEIDEIKETSTTDIEDVEWDESDPAFALFVDTPKAEVSETDSTDFFGAISLEKAFARLELVSDSDAEEVSTLSMARFERICAMAETVMQRVERMTAHL
ncbi:MAG: hypothetical protein M1814_001137 [Vezdaea aestivalis]|nr:MAG: hypothetical protein M1814_001137 [Vezdaea aestivalis]